MKTLEESWIAYCANIGALESAEFGIQFESIPPVSPQFRSGYIAALEAKTWHALEMRIRELIEHYPRQKVQDRESLQALRQVEQALSDYLQRELVLRGNKVHGNAVFSK